MGGLTLSQAISEAEDDLERKIGLGSIRQIECGVLQTIIEAARRHTDSEPLTWYPMDQVPEIEPGNELRVLVAWRSKLRDYSSSGEMYYLNGFVLDWEDEGPSAMTGWFDRYEAVDGDATYRAMSDEFVVHLGWAFLPVMPEARS